MGRLVGVVGSQAQWRACCSCSPGRVVFLCARRLPGSWPVARSLGVREWIGPMGGFPGSPGIGRRCARALWLFLMVVHVYALLRVYTPCAGIILCGSVHVYALVARVSALRGSCGRRSTWWASSRGGRQWGRGCGRCFAWGGSAVVVVADGARCDCSHVLVGCAGLARLLSSHVMWRVSNHRRAVLARIGEWCGSGCGFGRRLRGGHRQG